MAKKFGADVVINSKLPLPERLKQVQDMTDGVGADIVIESAGVPVVFEEALEFVRRGGKLIEVGHYTDTGSAKIKPWMICNKDVDIHGSWGYPGMIFEHALSLLSRTSLPIEDIITHKLPLEKADAALDMLGQQGVGKVILYMPE
jgi:L-iditol 2-dehydrogenase